MGSTASRLKRKIDAAVAKRSAANARVEKLNRAADDLLHKTPEYLAYNEARERWYQEIDSYARLKASGQRATKQKMNAAGRKMDKLFPAYAEAEKTIRNITGASKASDEWSKANEEVMYLSKLIREAT